MPEKNNNNFIRSSLMIATIYAVFGGLWILFSDRILASFVTDAAIMSKIQTYKGWTYVAVTALLVYILVRSMEKTLNGYLGKLRVKNKDLESAIEKSLQKEKEISELMKDVERKNEELESVISVSSHDLRSPLVNIEGFSGELAMDCSELIKLIKDLDLGGNKDKIEGILTEKIPESLGFITSSTRRMHGLQGSLLKICRLGKEDCVPESLDMNELLKEVNDSLKYMQDEKKVDISISDLPPCMGDRSQISQVFTNLIENSLKYLKTDTPGRIEVSGQLDGDEVVYCVKDNGIGIDKQYTGKYLSCFIVWSLIVVLMAME
jgi:light-regulated signal transduction histidine kinase (bacteriophytochrome)